MSGMRATALERNLLELGGGITRALEDVGVPAALLDRDAVIRWENKAAQIPRGCHIGHYFAELVAPDNQSDVHEQLTRVLRHGEPDKFALRVISPDLEPLSIQISIAPVRDGSTVIGIFGLGYVLDNKQPLHPPVSPVDLTPRQRDVLRLLGEGRSTAEMATQLALTRTTVRNHVASLLTALRAHSRLQAVATARQIGLLDP